MDGDFEEGGIVDFDKFDGVLPWGWGVMDFVDNERGGGWGGDGEQGDEGEGESEDRGERA